MNISTLIYQKSTFVITRPLKPETLIVPVRAGQVNLNEVYLLNEVAGRMWELFDGNRSADQIVGIIIQEYDVTAQEAWTDLQELINQLEERVVLIQVKPK